MSKDIEYENVEHYLRTFSTERSLYFGNLLHLVLTGIENLRQNEADGDILLNAHFITDGQATFLRHLLEGRAESIKSFINEISHTSQTGLL